MEIKYAYLGPQGTFSEEALIKHVKAKPENLIPMSTFEEIIKAVEKGAVQKGIVAIENSVEGSINITLDSLTQAKDVFIESEIIYPIVQNLISSSVIPLDKIKTIYTHPLPEAQCRKYISKYLSGAEIIYESSTAGAVKKVLSSGKGSAALGSDLAARIYGLKILTPKVNDYKNNKTRFVMIGKEQKNPTGYDKTSLVCYIANDQPGSLLTILKEFANRGINLTKIQSRPTKKKLGDYSFWIDLEGHIEDKKIAQAVDKIRLKIKMIKFIGSYPRAKKEFKS